MRVRLIWLFVKLRKFLKVTDTIDGAGVHLRRIIGFDDTNQFDPFLLLDEFGSDNPADYFPGFPWHPHRGIETITYMLDGEFRHGDSMGNGGVISLGDVQWMTAGSGIIHEEMPNQETGKIRGFQLWANLPASHKMMDPRYQGLTQNEIPEVNLESGTAKVICGELGGTQGPVKDIITEPFYCDITLSENGTFHYDIPTDYTAFANIIEGVGNFDPAFKASINSGHLIKWGPGEEIEIRTGNTGVRFLFITGNPIKEPVAWGGPIVMNTQAELRKAFEEYDNGTFLKHQKN